MKTERVAAAAVVLAAVALGFWLRLDTRVQLSAGDRVHPLGSDDNYHMRRARFAAANFPRTIVFDRLMNFPAGGVPIWPPLWDLVLAAPSRILHGPTASAGAIEREAAWIPPVVAGATIALAGGVGALLFGPAGAAIAALFLAVCPGHILWTQYGHTDQHVAESFFGTLVLLLFLRSRDGGADPARESAAGLALACAVLAWQGAIYWGAIFALALVLEALVTRRSLLRPALLVLGLPSAIVAVCTALWLGPFRPPFTYISFGFFQPLFLAALAAGTVLIDSALRAFRGQLTPKDAGRRIVVLVAAAGLVAPFTGPLAAGLARGIGYVLGRTGEISGAAGYVSYPRDWLKGIFEARPLFADGPGLAWKSLSAAFFLSPAAAALWVWRAARRERPGMHLALAVWAGVTLVLAVSQRLNVYYAALLAAATLVEGVRFTTKRLRSRSVRPAIAVLTASALALLLAFPMRVGLADELRAVRVPGSDLFRTLEWMRSALPHEVDAWDPRLLTEGGPPSLGAARSVLAPWSLGHLVLYNAELPVVANNFGYGFLDSIRFFLADTEEEGLRIARARRARWVLATDLAPRMNDYSGYLGRPPLFEGQSPTAAYFRTLQSRLYDFDAGGAASPEGAVPALKSFRLRFRSESAIQRGGRWVARWKVFEILSEDGQGARP